jgi:hypothetical protein
MLPESLILLRPLSRQGFPEMSWNFVDATEMDATLIKVDGWSLASVSSLLLLPDLSSNFILASVLSLF